MSVHKSRLELMMPMVKEVACNGDVFAAANFFSSCRYKCLIKKFLLKISTNVQQRFVALVTEAQFFAQAEVRHVSAADANTFVTCTLLNKHKPLHLQQQKWLMKQNNFAATRFLSALKLKLLANNS